MVRRTRLFLWTVALLLPATGQVISPTAPAREYIRVKGRVLAIEHLPPDGTVPGGLAISVKPAWGSIPVGASLALKAEVSGATAPSVTWTFAPSLGSLVANGANSTVLGKRKHAK